MREAQNRRSRQQGLQETSDQYITSINDKHGSNAINGQLTPIT